MGLLDSLGRLGVAGSNALYAGRQDERARQLAEAAEQRKTQEAALRDMLLNTQADLNRANAERARRPPQQAQRDPYDGRTREQYMQDLEDKAKIDARYPSGPRIINPPDPVAQELARLRLDEVRRKAEETRANAGKPEEPKTESGRKARFLLPGAESAVRKLGTLDKKVDLSAGVVKRLPLVGNAALRSGMQEMEQATMTLADAYLRMTTGATISPEEVRNTAKQMLPEFGDKPAVVKAKRERRDQVIASLREAAGLPAPPSRPAQRKPARVRATELRKQGLSDEEIRAKMEQEGYEFK